MLPPPQGVIAPLLTPFTAAHELDEAALAREVRFLAASGARAIAVCMTTGEGAMLDAAEQERVCRLAVAEIGGGLPVWAGLIGDSTREVVSLGRGARRAGAAAVVVPPVHYLHVPPPAAMRRFYEEVVGEVGLPVVVYNGVPTANLAPTFCAELLELPGILAIKAGNERFPELAELLERVADRSRVLSAFDDLLLPSLVLGVGGLFTAIAALLPRACVELEAAFRRGDLGAAQALSRRLFPVVRAVLTEESYPSTMKYAARRLGRDLGWGRPPLAPLSEEAALVIDRALGLGGFVSPSQLG